MGEIVFLNPK